MPPKSRLTQFTRGLSRLVGKDVSPSPPRGWEYHNGVLRQIRARSVSPDTDARDRVERSYRDRSDAIRQVHYQEVQLAVDAMIAGLNAQYGINLNETDRRVRWIIERIISVHGLTDAAVIRIQSCRTLLVAISDVIGPTLGNIAQGATVVAGLVRTATARVSRWGRSRSVEPIRLPDEPGALRFATMALTGLHTVLARIYGILGTCAGAACHAIAARLPAALDRAVPVQDLVCAICMDNAIAGQVAGQAPVLTQCNHRFHRSCIDEWFAQCRGNRRPETCPYCRLVATPLRAEQPGGGGTRSKSKSRRYPRKPHKTRKV